MKIHNRKTGLIFDLFFCVVFMPVIIFLGPAHYWLTAMPVFFCLECSYCYGIYFFLSRASIPFRLVSRNYTRLILWGIALIVINYLITLYPFPDVDFVIPSLSAYQTEVRDYNKSLSIWLMFSLVVAYSIVVSLVKELYDQLLRWQEVENLQTKARLAIFQAKISPHFLFNTLNSLYSLVLGTSPQAEDAFIKFTSILKYTYLTIEKDWVLLKEEIEYLQNYMDLQKLRLNHHTSVEWICDIEEEEDVLIPPMILLTFVENAFKYGSSTSHDCKIAIRVSLKKNSLEFSTSNRLMRHSSEFRSDMPIGIDNCRARLEALFPYRYNLETFESDGIFKLDLKLNFN